MNATRRPTCLPSSLPTLLIAILFGSLALASDFADGKEADRELTKQTPGVQLYLGRQIAPPMSYRGADWLMRKTREQEERPEELYEFLKIKPGQEVCDFGCGNGYHALQMSRRVGPRGKVYAVDIQQEMLDLLARRVEARGLQNIEPVLAKPNAPGLPKGKLDLVLMVDVYHELADPPAVLADLKKSLNAKGRLVLVEFREEDPSVPIRPLHKMSKKQVQRELVSQDFHFIAQYDRLPWQHVVVYSPHKAAYPKVDLVRWQPPNSQVEEEK